MKKQSNRILLLPGKRSVQIRSPKSNLSYYDRSVCSGYAPSSRAVHEQSSYLRPIFFCSAALILPTTDLLLLCCSYSAFLKPISKPRLLKGLYRKGRGGPLWMDSISIIFPLKFQGSKRVDKLSQSNNSQVAIQFH